MTDRTSHRTTDDVQYHFATSSLIADVRLQLAKSLGGSQRRWVDAVMQQVSWSEVEKFYRLGLSACRNLDHLGPHHAALAERYARWAPLLLAGEIIELHQSGNEIEAPNPEEVGEHLDRQCESIMQGAAQMSYTPAGGDPHSPSSRRERARLILEGSGISASHYRARITDLHHAAAEAWPQLWDLLGKSPPRLNLDRSRQLGSLASYEPQAWPTPTVYLDLTATVEVELARSHGLPGLFDIVEELREWDPCLSLASAYQPPAGMLLVHEAMHALATTFVEPFDPDLRHAPTLPALAWRRQLVGLNVYIAGANAGDQISYAVLSGLRYSLFSDLALAQLSEADRPGGADAAIVLAGSAVVSEALAEAMTRLWLPSLRQAVSDPRLWWGGDGDVRSPYDRGVEFMNALFSARQIKNLLHDPDQLELLMNAVSERMLPSDATLFQAWYWDESPQILADVLTLERPESKEEESPSSLTDELFAIWLTRLQPTSDSKRRQQDAL